MYQKTGFFQRSLLRETSDGLTMGGGCINKHGGLKTSYAWPARFMSRLYGKRWQLLSFNTSAAAKTWHRDILTHLRSCTCSWNIRFRHPAGTSPPALRSTVQGAIVLWSCLLLKFTSSATALSPHSPLWVQLPRPDCTAVRRGTRCGGRGTLGCPPVLAQISICEWNPAVNKPSAPSSALRLQLGLQKLVSYLALLNSAWTIIPGELPERAKEFSLYITGWCLHKSSHGIWQVAFQQGSGLGLMAARRLLPVSNHLQPFDNH